MFPRHNQQTGRRLRSTDELNSPTQQRLYNLLQREELLAKRSRVGHVLTHQLAKKYASGIKNKAALLDYVQGVVSQALSQSDDLQLSEALLESLEATVREGVEKLKSEPARATATATFAAATESSLAPATESDGGARPEDSSSAATVDTGKASRNGPRTAPSSSALPEDDSFDPNQWSVMNAFLALNDEDKNQREKEVARKKMSDFKRGLDNQSSAIKARAQNDDDEKRRLAEATRKYATPGLMS
jgi:hypothetical protein